MIAKRRTNPLSSCPLTAAMSALGGKWKLIILFWLAESPLHFGAIEQRIQEISHKVLSEQLGELMADDIVKRSLTGEPPAPVMYALTEHGRSAIDMLHATRAWGITHIAHFKNAASPSTSDSL